MAGWLYTVCFTWLTVTVSLEAELLRVELLGATRHPSAS